MPKQAVVFVCQQCGSAFPKWAGQCPQCGAWNSLVETLRQVQGKHGKRGATAKAVALKPVRLSEVAGISQQRIPTGIGELDRVLGGGVVPGSVVLVAGEPGIGKSTLLTQLALYVGYTNSKLKTPSSRASLLRGRQNAKPQRKTQNGQTVLYVCGEESPAQIRMRVERIAQGAKGPSILSGFEGLREQGANLLFLPETDVDAVVATIEKEKPSLVIVDSIQTLTTGDFSSSAGSITQVSECASRFLTIAKQLSIPVFLVGHVTKEGAIAGPKVLEHMVDCVLELTGDRQHEFRLLRASKNRFGATDEVGVFSMEEDGMAEVTNPSDRFLSERQAFVPGSCVVAVLEGTRVMLLEIQALVVPTNLAIPRRVASGIDLRRLQLLVAVLMKRCGLRLGQADVFVNVAGGLTVHEPAADLGVCLAIASSLKNAALPKLSVAVGEVGLLGEIRKVPRLVKRIAEARAQGFRQVVSAEGTAMLQAALRLLLR